MPDACGNEAKELLLEIVARAFAIRNGYEDLNRITKKAIAFDLFEHIGDGSGPMLGYVWKIEQAVVARGDGERCLAALYCGLPGNFELREWIRRYRPDLFGLVSEQLFVGERDEYEKGRHVGRVDRVKQKVDALAGFVRLSDAQRRLSEKMLDQLDELTVYKSLHDALHQMQIRTLADLDQVLNRDYTPEQVDEIVFGHVQDLELARVKLEGQFALMPRLASAGGPYSTLIGDLDQVVELLTADGSAAPGAYRKALFRLRSLLRWNMPLLDDQLVGTAAAIPFSELADQLDSLGRPEGGPALPPDRLAALQSVCETLRAIDRRLAWRRDVHQFWQRVDAILWQAETALRGDVYAEDLGFMWEDLQELTDKIEQINPGQWAKQLQAQSKIVIASGINAPQSPSVQLRSAFRGYAKIARMTFLKADWTMLQDCQELKGLRAPIKALQGG